MKTFVKKYAAHARMIASITAIIVFLFAPLLQAQTPVNISPVPRQQFFTGSGVPLAGGCIFTYQSGTSTPLGTYTDATGTILNSNPVILDGGGFASIWIQQVSYRFVVFSSGGTNCATGTQQWVADNVSGSILNQANTWTQPQTFSGGLSIPLPLTLTQGGFNNQLTASVTAARTWTLPDASDTFVMLNTTQLLTNKTLNTPIINTPTVTQGSFLNPSLAGTGLLQPFTNNGSGTGANLLVKLTGAPSTAVTIATTDSFGIVGICLLNCTSSGTAQVSISGQANCVFDGATVAGDYVTPSPAVAGNCRDAGASYPSTGQIVGRVLSTNGSNGTYSIVLFPAEQRVVAGYKTECVNVTPVTVGNTVTPTNLQSCTLPANEILANSIFYMDVQGIIGNTSGPAFTLTVLLDGVSLGTFTPTLSTANTQPFAARVWFAGVSTGVSGQVTGAPLLWQSTPSGGGGVTSVASNATGVAGPPQFVTINTMTSHVFALQATWGTAAALNTITSNVMAVYRMNQ